MGSFAEHDAEINKLHKMLTSKPDSHVEEVIDLVEEVKYLITYAETPKEVDILVKAYTELYNLNKVHSW